MNKELVAQQKFGKYTAKIYKSKTWFRQTKFHYHISIEPDWRSPLESILFPTNQDFNYMHASTWAQITIHHMTEANKRRPITHE